MTSLRDHAALLVPNAARGGLARDVVAGAVASLLPISNCFSYAALLFSGSWARFLGEGVAVLLISGAVISLTVAITSSFRVVVAAPIAATSALLAAMLVRLAQPVAGQPDAVALATAYAALGAATLGTGAIMVALSYLRVGRAIRFLPFPVIAGFLGATGWLMVEGAVRVATDVPLELDRLPRFTEPRTGLLLLGVVSFAAVLFAITRKLRHQLSIPLTLIAATLGVDGYLRLSHTSFVAARAGGLLFDVAGSAPLTIPLLSGSWSNADWSAVAHVVPDMIPIVVIGTMQALLTATGLEISLDTDVSLDRELWSQGAANLASGLLGGITGFAATSYTRMNTEAGARGRASGVIVALVALAAMVWGNAVISMIPRFVLGGLLLMLGAMLVWEWSIASRRRMPLREWLIAVSMVPVTASFGFLPALLTGLVGGCALLALSMSQVSVVRRRYAINEEPSSLLRPEAEMLALAANGGQARVVVLGGFIFFGSAYQFYNEMKAIISAGEVRLLVVDFSAVTGVDSSAMATLSRIRALAHRNGLSLLIAGENAACAAALDSVFGASVTRYAAVDEAVEATESAVLAAHMPLPGPVGDGSRHSQWLTSAFGDADLASRFSALLSFASHAAGTVLCRQGDATDALLFIESGRVGVLVERPGQSPIRVRVFGRQTIAGELAFLLGTPRTATLLVEQDASVGVLDRAAFQSLRREQPEIALALLDYLVRVQAERLTFANRRIIAAQG